MLAILAAQILLVVSHDAAARGQLRPLEKYADRAGLAVSLDGGNSSSAAAAKGNAIADSAIEALARWPALVAVELLPPINPHDAISLRRLKRFAVRLPPPSSSAERPATPIISLKRARREIPSLALLGPSLVRVEQAPSTALGPGPCPGTEERVLPDGGSEIRVQGEVTRCLLDWLHSKLDPHAEPIGDLPPDPRSPVPKPAPRR